MGRERASVPARLGQGVGPRRVGTGIQALPPFWIAFAFVFLVSLPQAFLALPIAAAPVGPLPGVAVIAGLGLLNLLTVACMAEAVARSAAVRRGDVLVAGVVREFLGGPAALLVTAALGVTFFLALIASALGLSLTLADETSVPALAWLVVLAAAVLCLLAQAALGLQVLVLLGAANAAMLAVILVLVLPDVHPRQLREAHVPFTEGRGFDRALWQGLLGVSLISYFGHALVGQSARLVLPRDPSGRTLVRGSVAGMAALLALLSAWVLVLDTDLPLSHLVGQRGTVLIDLEAHAGLDVAVLGTLLVVALPGLTALRCAVVLFNLVRERLPPSADTSATSGIGRFVVCSAPALAGFAVVGVMVETGAGSFTQVLGVAGVLGVAVFAGIVPPLLLLASRRADGRTPHIAPRFLGHPALAVGVSLLFLGNILVHGLVIWQPVGERLAAGFAVAAIVAVTILTYRNGAVGRAA